MKTRIVKIGNSRGIRIPKPILEQMAFDDDVELEVVDDQLIIRAAREPRSGWGSAFKAMARSGDDELLDGDEPVPTDWDEDEWEW